MVETEIFEDGAGRIISFRINGHAGYASSGEDIVCAAVSALAQTAVLGLSCYLAAKPLVVLRDGLLTCTLPPMLTAVEGEQAEVILRTMYLGLTEIERNYQQYVQVKKRRWLE